jgi:hypothetical protein
MMSWIFEYFQTVSLWQSFVGQIVEMKCRGISGAAYEEPVHFLLDVLYTRPECIISFFALFVNMGIR